MGDHVFATTPHNLTHPFTMAVPEGFIKNEISYELQRKSRFSQLKKELRAKLGTAFPEEGIAVLIIWNKGSVEGEIGHRS